MSHSTEKATLAAGCFWGVEHLFRKNFGNGKGVLDAKVGYCGGSTASPSYRAVCTGDTGRKLDLFFTSRKAKTLFYLFIFLIVFFYDNADIWNEDAEAVELTFDPSTVTYRSLLEFFYRMHDPTTANRQGPDVGTQYRSAIFTHGEEQEKTARDVTEKVSKQWYKQPLSTVIIPAAQWWDAEEYHQLYLDKNPGGYECPAQYVLTISFVKCGFQRTERWMC